MSWRKHGDGLWEKGDVPPGMDLGPVNWRYIGLAIVAIALLVIAVLVEHLVNRPVTWQAEPKPLPVAAIGVWCLAGLVFLAIVVLFVTRLVQRRRRR